MSESSQVMAERDPVKMGRGSPDCPIKLSGVGVVRTGINW